MCKYKCGHIICSKGNRDLVFKVVNMNFRTYSLEVVKARFMRMGAVMHLPKRIVESKTEPLIVEDNV